MHASEYAAFAARGGVTSLRKCSIFIDLTLLLRKKGPECLKLFKSIHKHCTLHLTKDYSERMFHLVDSTQYQSFFSDAMYGYLKDSWSLLPTLDICKVYGLPETYGRFSLHKGKKVFATGNETEALRHILNRRKGDILLVTDEGIYLIKETMFARFARKFGKMEQGDSYAVPSPAERKCYYGTNGSVYPVAGILNAEGREGVLFQSGNHVLKCYYDGLTRQKEKKLAQLMGRRDKKGDYLWPQTLLRATPLGQIAGFVMDRAEFECSIDDLLCGYELSDFDRWLLAANFTAQVLYLYLFDIQIGDYNRGNFGVQDNFHISFMDIDSYIVGRLGTETRSSNRIRFCPDRRRKSDVILADYYYLHATVFYLLTNGRWPYYFEEAQGPGTYILGDEVSCSPNITAIFHSMPADLRRYFSMILDKQTMKDPFELYEQLLKAKAHYENKQEANPPTNTHMT